MAALEGEDMLTPQYAGLASGKLSEKLFKDVMDSRDSKRRGRVGK